MDRCHYCDRPAWYQDRETGQALCMGHARIEVRGPRRPDRVNRPPLLIRPSTPADGETIVAMWKHFWEEDDMECFGRLYRAAELPAFLACDGDKVVGVLSYGVERDWEAINIVVLNLAPSHQGRGGATGLMSALEEEAKCLGIGRLIVATSNDNVLALAFYQRQGFTISQVLAGAIESDDPAVPHLGVSNIPVRDEIQLEKRL